MLVKGTVTRFEELPAQDGKPPLHTLSIEGFGVLVPADLVADCPSTGGVLVLVEVQWRSKKRPIHWLRAVEAISLSDMLT